MKIRKLHLKNIGVFDDEEIEFKECPAKNKAEIHILTGENGTGKTTILQVLASIFNNDDSNWNSRKTSDFAIINIEINNLSKRARGNGLDSEFAFEIEVENEKKEYKTEILSTSIYAVTPYDVDNSVDWQLFFYGRGKVYKFAVFAHSGYRQIEDEIVQANYFPKNFNPLSQSLEFIKDYRKKGEITINQLVANNISNRALSKEDGSLEEAKKYETVINSIETFIKDVTDYEVKFVLKRSPNELKLRMHGEELDFDVLPDGLRSLISWIADLLGRVDLLKWNDDLPITEKNLILLLDEIEVHLHPAWQRKVLPVVQKLFKNAQIFVSTHSPFVVNSVDDAWIYKLKLDEKGKAKCEEPIISEDGYSYETVLREVFGINERFGEETQERLEGFLKDSRTIFQQNGNNQINKDKFLNDAKNLASESAELQSIVFLELAKLSKKTGEPYEI